MFKSFCVSSIYLCFQRSCACVSLLDRLHTLQVLFGRKQREASERKAAALEQQRLALTGQEGKEKRGEHGEHDGDVLPHKPLQMLQASLLSSRTYIYIHRYIRVHRL